VSGGARCEAIIPTNLGGGKPGRQPKRKDRRVNLDDRALHAFNVLASLPVSALERGWLLRQLHQLADRNAPPEGMATALMTMGMVRSLKKLAVVKGFGRRRRAYLRYSLTRPDLQATMARLLHVLTATAPDIPPVPNHHPLGDVAWFPPWISEQLMLHGHRVHGTPRPLEGYPFSHPRILSVFDALTLRPPPTRPLIIGGDHAARDLGFAWAQHGTIAPPLEPPGAPLAP